MTRGALFLVGFALLATALLWWMDQITGARIADNELQQRLAALRAVLPDGAYDNEPHLDSISVTSRELLGDTRPLPVYRARRGTEPVAAVVTAVAPNGYTGPIRMLVGIGTDGHTIAVRVTQHTETPGLGDDIDADKSDWVGSFRGLPTADPLSPEWTMTKDGGRFDHMSGATVTSHAVVNAVRNAVIYFNANREELFAPIAAEPPQ